MQYSVTQNKMSFVHASYKKHTQTDKQLEQKQKHQNKTNKQTTTKAIIIINDKY